MTATAPRPRLAPAAEALAAAHVQDMGAEPPPPLAVSAYDGGEDEFHHCGEAWVGSQETPGFEAWLEDLERRVGPVPLDGSRDGRLLECSVSGRRFVGDLKTPEFRAWRERQRRRTEDSIARCLDRARSGATAGNKP